MIKNLILDMGNVLVDFSPDYIFSQYTDDLDLIKYLKEKIIYTDIWGKLDNGDISFDDAAEIIIKDIDEKYHDLVSDFFKTWYLHKTERLDMLEYISELKGKGFNAYLLSNVAPIFQTYKDNYGFTKLLDGMVLSGELMMSKPGDAIYLHLLDEFNLDANTCLFIDDSFANIMAADKLGFYTYHYNGNLNRFKDFMNNTILKKMV